MAFELDHRKHIDRQLRKIARRQLQRTIRTLDADGSDGGTFSRAVHESLKSVK